MQEAIIKDIISLLKDKYMSVKSTLLHYTTSNTEQKFQLCAYI